VLLLIHFVTILSDIPRCKIITKSLVSPTARCVTHFALLYHTATYVCLTRILHFKLLVSALRTNNADTLL